MVCGGGGVQVLFFLTARPRPKAVNAADSLWTQTTDNRRNLYKSLACHAWGKLAPCEWDIFPLCPCFFLYVQWILYYDATSVWIIMTFSSQITDDTPMFFLFWFCFDIGSLKIKLFGINPAPETKVRVVFVFLFGNKYLLSIS